MKFTFKNLGKLDEAVIDLKDLNLVCGTNNTGKTYLLYAIYGFLDYWNESFESNLSKENKNQLFQDSYLTIDLNEKYSLSSVSAILNEATRGFAKVLHRYFASSSDSFEKVEILLEISEEEHEQWFKNVITASEDIKIEFSRKNSEKAKQIFMNQDSNNVLTIKISDPLTPIEKQIVSEIVEKSIKERFFESLLPKPFLSSCERTGIVTFLKELDFARSRLVDILGQSSEIKPHDILESFFVKHQKAYPKPITDNVTFIRDLPTLKTIQKQEIQNDDLKTSLNHLEEMISGKLEVDKSGNLYLKQGRLKLEMNQASSSVRAMVDIYFYVQAQAKKKNKFLMIDEPEMNLHPKNQRAMARFLASLVNQGIKVMVSTHSDYLVRELNHLTALHKFKDQDSVKTYLASEDNPYSEEVLISNEKVGLYFTKVIGKKVKLHQAPISQYGTFTVASFDNEIKAQQQAEFDILEAIHGRNGDED
jgi:predicted ATPase